MPSTDIYNILSSISHNQHYLARYIKFIKHYSDTHTSHEYTEKHHICPKALFPEYSNLSKNKWNIAILTGRQHFIAHMLLAKVYGEKMIYCLYLLSKQCNISINSIQYQTIKKYARKYASENNKEKLWWHNKKTNKTLFQKNKPNEEFELGRNITFNKNKIAYYNTTTLDIIYLNKHEIPPDNYTKGSPKSQQTIWYDTNTGKTKYFNKGYNPPDNYIKGSPTSKSWRYKNINTGNIIYSKYNNLHLCDDNIILYPILKDKKCYYNPETLEMKFFNPESAPEGWINKNIKQIGQSKTKNRKWYNYQGKSKMFYPDNVPEGWAVGRK